MQQATQIKIVDELLQQLDNDKNVDAGVGYQVPGSDYVCPERAQKEWHAFFQYHPQFIGLSGDLPEPGSYFTTSDFGTPVLATRDKDGQFHAFLDACVHRGVQLSKQSRGKAFKFTCPFHSWTYASSGELVSVPRETDFGAIDKSCNSLISLPAVEKHGMLFVHPQPDGEIDVDNLLHGLTDELAHWSFDRFIYKGETVIESELNWKLANDTFGETYHFQRLHKDTLGQLFHGDNLAYETFGRNHRFVFASKGIDALRKLPQEEWTVNGTANVLYYLFPNLQLNVANNNILAIKIYPHPSDPNRSLTRVGIYFSPEAIAMAESGEYKVRDASDVYQADADGERSMVSLEASVEVFNSTIEQEDYLMGESTQRAVRSGVLKHLQFGRNEPALHHYHKTFREALNLPPLETLHL